MCRYFTKKSLRPEGFLFWTYWIWIYFVLYLFWTDYLRELAGKKSVFSYSATCRICAGKAFAKVTPLLIVMSLTRVTSLKLQLIILQQYVFSHRTFTDFKSYATCCSYDIFPRTEITPLTEVTLTSTAIYIYLTI